MIIALYILLAIKAITLIFIILMVFKVRKRNAEYGEKLAQREAEIQRLSRNPPMKLLPLLLLLCGCVYKPSGETCHCAPMGFTVPHGPNGRLGTETFYPIPNPF